MAYILITKNPYEPTDVDKKIVSGGITIWEWLRSEYPGFTEFEHPTFCLVNGQPVKREGWNHKIKDEDIINFITMPDGFFAVIAIVIIAVIALAVTFAMTTQPPITPGETPASDPVFSVKGQSNGIRLGEPIEVVYGRCRVYPSLASRPYFQYRSNDQYQYSLFCIGQGEYDINQIQIGDSPIGDFAEVEYEVVPPGGTITLFPTNVHTSVEAGGQEIFAPNEEEYEAPGYVGPFPAVPSGSQATKLQVDLIYPKGVYAMADDGSLTGISVTTEIEYREIDDAGAPIGGWNNFTSPFPHVFTAATTTPQRITLEKTVAAGRYEVRMRRNIPKLISHKAGNSVVWEGLRSHVTDTVNDFGNVTLLAVIVRATNNLNDRTQLKFNVVVTRRLPVYDHGEFGDPEPSRSIVWAFVDVFRATYGARLADVFFDWDTLLELDELYTERNEFFDWIFRDPITVWEAARTIATVGRATPLLVGSMITMKRDAPAEIPVTMFVPDNIKSGSFNHQVKLWDIDEYDSLRIEYTEPATGYKQENILVTLPGGTTDHPKDLRIPGIANRTHAHRAGLYLLASEFHLRDNFSFDTGMEGYIPTFGDLIAVSHDVPRWGQSGYILHAVLLETGGSEYQLWLSQPLDWSETGEHVMMLRGRHAEVLGPFPVLQPTADDQVVIVIPPETEEFDFLLGGENEPMLFVFGVSGSVTQMAKVIRAEPQSGEIVKITAVNYAEEIHDYDDEVPGAWTPPSEPDEIPLAPVVTNLYLSQIDGPVTNIQAAWSAAAGALRYVVESSVDGENWASQGTTIRPSLTFPVPPGTYQVRVAGVGAVQGDWVTETITVKALVGLTLDPEFDGLEWGVNWSEVPNATGFTVKVYDNSESAPILERTTLLPATTREYEYDFTMATADGNINREMLVEVNPEYADGTSGAAAELAVSNPVPLPPTSPGSEEDSVESEEVIYRLYWTVPAEDDLIRVKVWLSSISGFDPEVDVPVFDDTAGSPGFAGIADETLQAIPLESDGSHPAYYWRVALFDVWGNEIETNITGEQVIPAYP